MKWLRIKNVIEWLDYKTEFLSRPGVTQMKFPNPNSYPILVPAAPEDFVGQVTSLPMVYGDDVKTLQGEIE